MSDAGSRIYVTTPIYYVNDRPHIGHLYTTTVCDVYARFMRFSGHDVFFLTGTDEHGVKVEKSAQARGISPQALADENAAFFREAFSRYHLTNDDFIRTTQPEHERQVQAFVSRLLETDAVYLGDFEGWYDEGQEEYYTDTRARELEYKSPVNGQPLVRSREQNYFFRLSAFQERLEQLFEKQPEFVRPMARRNEVVARVRDGLLDVPMSRTNFTWGVSMPNAPEHVIYVWIDALMNYVTALGLGEPDGAVAAERSGYWPATFHVIGKEILWFHAVIWPAMLMALDLPLPRCIYAHSFWIREGQKMSKTLGNFIDLETIERYVDHYGLDQWRYYTITQGPLGATDANFAAGHFHDVYHTDLVNTVGNCASRVTAMIVKYFDGVVPGESRNGNAIRAAEHDWPTLAASAVAESTDFVAGMELPRGIAAAVQLIRRVDGFINATEPFKLARDESRRDELAAILYQCLEAVRIASLLLWCVIPDRMETLWQTLSLEIDPRGGNLADLTRWGGLKPGTRIEKVALYPRIEPIE